MRPTVLTGIAGTALLAALAMPFQLTAQEQPATPEHKLERVRYTIRDLGTLGGTSSLAFDVTDNSLVSGTAALPNGTSHAVLWYGGQPIDLGTPGLEGDNSVVLNSIAFTVNRRSQAVGQVERSGKDPNGEDFCGYKTGLICLPFVWQNGAMTPLPTLGGYNGLAISINNRGEVTGVAENSIRDSSCATANLSQVVQFEAVLWKTRQSEKQELIPLPGDSVGIGLWVNDNGQAVGVSGSCANTILPPLAAGPHMVMWEKNGTPIDLGNLGGESGNAALYINNEGQVVGGSNLSDQGPLHAFLWTGETGKIQDLGTLEGDVASVALGINDRGEIVGTSIDATGNTRAFLYKHEKMIDLQALIPADSPLLPIDAEVINSSGQIAGFGVTSTGDVHGFLATPCDRNHTNTKWCGNEMKSDGAEAEETAEGPKTVLPENTRQQLQQRLGRGYRVGRFRY